jgi:predicted nucleotidyltransferase
MRDDGLLVMDDGRFLTEVADRLAALPGVVAVSLGGSRGQGTHRPDSDWDLGIYYRGRFEPQTLRDVGWFGGVSEIGAWGGDVFNGGAWLVIDGRAVDVHYRDLDAVLAELADARVGRFRIVPLLFHLAGIPSYLVIAELAINRVLRGELPRPDYPAALRASAPATWWRNAEMVFKYADSQHATHGRLAQCAGLLVQAASQAGHAVLAARGEWVTNEKALLTRAGLGEIDRIVAELRPEPAALGAAVDQAMLVCAKALRDAVR